MAFAVDAICSGFGYHIQDQACCLAVFGIVIIRNDLKSLHFVHRCACAIAAGHQLIRDICSIYVIKIAAIIN